jgi:hypothetical protein
LPLPSGIRLELLAPEVIIKTVLPISRLPADGVLVRVKPIGADQVYPVVGEWFAELEHPRGKHCGLSIVLPKIFIRKPTEQ